MACQVEEEVMVEWEVHEQPRQSQPQTRHYRLNINENNKFLPLNY